MSLQEDFGTTIENERDLKTLDLTGDPFKDELLLKAREIRLQMAGRCTASGNEGFQIQQDSYDAMRWLMDARKNPASIMEATGVPEDGTVVSLIDPKSYLGEDRIKAAARLAHAQASGASSYVVDKAARRVQRLGVGVRLHEQTQAASAGKATQEAGPDAGTTPT